MTNLPPDPPEALFHIEMAELHMTTLARNVKHAEEKLDAYCSEHGLSRLPARIWTVIGENE